MNVKLADRSAIETKHYLNVLVQFSGLATMLRFTVLPVECPAILGMPFLRHINPDIDWQRRTVSFPRAQQ